MKENGNTDRSDRFRSKPQSSQTPDTGHYADNPSLEVVQREIRPLNGFAMLLLITVLMIASIIVIVIGGLRISAGGSRS